MVEGEIMIFRFFIYTSKTFLTMVTLNGHSRKKIYIKCPNVFQPAKSTGPASSKDIIGWLVGHPVRPCHPAEMAKMAVFWPILTQVTLVQVADFDLQF